MNTLNAAQVLECPSKLLVGVNRGKWPEELLLMVLRWNSSEVLELLNEECHLMSVLERHASACAKAITKGNLENVFSWLYTEFVGDRWCLKNDLFVPLYQYALRYNRKTMISRLRNLKQFNMFDAANTFAGEFLRCLFTLNCKQLPLLAEENNELAYSLLSDARNQHKFLVNLEKRWTLHKTEKLRQFMKVLVETDGLKNVPFTSFFESLLKNGSVARGSISRAVLEHKKPSTFEIKKLLQCSYVRKTTASHWWWSNFWGHLDSPPYLFISKLILKALNQKETGMFLVMLLEQRMRSKRKGTTLAPSVAEILDLVCQARERFPELKIPLSGSAVLLFILKAKNVKPEKVKELLASCEITPKVLERIKERYPIVRNIL